MNVEKIIGNAKEYQTVSEADKTVALIPRAIRAALNPIEKWIMGKEYNLKETEMLLAKKLKSVDPEKIVSPPPYVAIPALQAISYCMDNAELRDLYAELLKNAMTVDTIDNVHPTFVEIIKQMSPFDAVIFKKLAQQLVVPCLGVRYEKQDKIGYPIIDCYAIEDTKNFPIIQTQFAIENLERLKLIDINKRFRYNNKQAYEELKKSEGFNKFINDYINANAEALPMDKYSVQIEEYGIMVRAFGQFFAKACTDITWQDVI